MTRLLSTLVLTLAFLVPAGAADAQSSPVIERIQPASGPPGTEVQVIGRGLSRDAVIRLGETTLEVVRRGPTRWTVRLPDGVSSGTVVLEAGGRSFEGPFFRVTAAPPRPEISGVSPGQAPPGAEVEIRGENFSARPLGNRVSLSGRSVVIRSATPTRLVVIVPEGAETGSFEVQVDRAGAATSEEFTVTQGTSITEVIPPMGPPGAEVRVVGTGFAERTRDNRVFVGNTPLRVLSASPTELRVRLPRRFTDAHLLVDVRGASRAQSPTEFRLQERPVISAFEPPSSAPGGRVTIRGEHFGVDPRAVSVTLGETPVPIRGIADDGLVIEIPEGAAAGAITVRVHELGVTSAEQLSVLVPVAVSDFTPRSGPVGTIVTLTGQGFSPELGDNRVTIGGVNATIVSVNGPELQFEVPSTNSGRVEVAVADNGQVLTDELFVITTPPFVATFEPAAGTPGTEVLIRGSQFGTDSRLVLVRIGDRRMEVAQVRPDQIIARIPRQAETGRIRVTVQMQGTASSGSDFRVIPTSAVEGLLPTDAYAGREVVLSGYGFPPAGVQVRFAGADPVAPHSISAREIRVEVPADAVSGPVALIMEDGRTLPAPAELSVVLTPDGLGIESMRPSCTHVGCQVTIRGYGFEARARRNRVFFGSRRVRVDRATATSLVVTLPNSPGTNPIRVEVANRGEAETEPLTITQRFQMEMSR